MENELSRENINAFIENNFESYCPDHMSYSTFSKNVKIHSLPLSSEEENKLYTILDEDSYAYYDQLNIIIEPAIDFHYQLMAHSNSSTSAN